MTLPTGLVLVSDDIRYEIGGKNSIVGIYTGTMDFAQPTLPAALPRIAFTIMLRWRDRGDAEPVAVQIYGPADSDNPLAELRLDPKDMPPMDPELEDDLMGIGLVAQLQLEGVPLRAPGAFLGFVVTAQARERILRLPVRHRPMDHAQFLASLGFENTPRTPSASTP